MVGNLDSQDNKSVKRVDANDEHLNLLTKVFNDERLGLLTKVFNEDFGPAVGRFNEAFNDFQKSEPDAAEAAMQRLDKSIKSAKHIYDSLKELIETIDLKTLNESQAKGLSAFKATVNKELRGMKERLIVAKANLEGKLALLEKEGFLTKALKVVRFGKHVAGKGLRFGKRTTDKAVVKGTGLIPSPLRSFLGKMADYTDHFGFLD